MQYSMEKRRDIVYELAKWSDGATEVLQTWSRQDILQILCSEMGKERKYTGLTKLKIIEHLLKIVSEKICEGDDETVMCERPRPSSPSSTLKMSKKPEKLSRLVDSASATNISAGITDSDSAVYCKNVACKARLNNGDLFCKRCTCCVCHKYDDNKDPSLWLTCNSEPPFPGNSCNMSCHLDCALKHARSGIARGKLVVKLDGAYFCISCGKSNDLMSCWRKQLIVAKETRRVDVLCYRISLSQKLISGTMKYQKLSKTVDNAVRLLEAEVGTLSGCPVTMSRGIVNRLSSGQEVQRLCASAVESFDLISCPTPLHQDSKLSSPIIGVEAICAATNYSSLSDPSSVEDETTNVTACCDLNENVTEHYFDYYKTNNKMVDPNSSNEPLNSTNVSQEQNPSCGSDEEHATGKLGFVDHSNTMKQEPRFSRNGSNDLEKADQLLQPCVGLETSLLITPPQKENLKVGITRKRRSNTHDVERAGYVPTDGCNLEYNVKVIRRLECEGHIDKSFRQKFLTWYSIRATPQEIRIVKAFVDTLIEDPLSLSEQLVDTFGEIVSCKRASDIPHGFCLKLWH